MHSLVRILRRMACGWLACGLCAAAGSHGIAVTTYHYDAQRTGWNMQETSLSASAFPASFGVLKTVAVDGQVDAQPLLVPDESIAGGVHDVLYVVTEHNSVYAIDAANGEILAHRNLGTPVPIPLGCSNNGANVGINSTPVIDLARHRIYVIAYVKEASPQYRLHALNLLTLADAKPPVTVAATHKLTDGSTFAFDATYQRQRPALLDLNGHIYAGFGSFCDFEASHSRGWVLGWNADNLAPLSAAQLNDTRASSSSDFYLSSVWMSGFGLASNGSHIFFSTGNSDCNFYVFPERCPPQTTYNGITNIQESVVALEPTLAARAGVFTPVNVFELDQRDDDLGAGGVLLLPKLANGSNLASIVSKDGRLFLLDQSNLATPLDRHQLAKGCWCGPSYYEGPDGIARIVSGAGTLQTWQVVTKPTPHLVAESSTSTIPASAQDPGFFTVVSSNEGVRGTAIIWAVGRPTSTTPGPTLYAFAAKPAGGTLKLLYSARAGEWPNLQANANIVPLVVNGKVYVGAYKTVTIFGAKGSPAAAASLITAHSEAVAADSEMPANVSRVTGTLLSVGAAQLTLLTRAGRELPVNVERARENERTAPLVIGEPYTVLGPKHAAGTPLEATSITRAKPGEGAWPPDL